MNAEKCVDTIFDYMDKSLGLNDDEIIENFDEVSLSGYDTPSFTNFTDELGYTINGFSGYWSVKYSLDGQRTGFHDLFKIEQDEQGNITGTRYRTQYNKEFELDIQGSADEESIFLRTYWMKDYFNTVMKKEHNTSFPSPKYRGDDYYYNIIEIDDLTNKRYIEGWYTVLTLYNDGTAKHGTSLPLTMTKVKKPSLFQSEFDYLEELRGY